MQFLITGGAGFIGSNLIRYIIENTDDSVINVDNLTYAGNLESLNSIDKSKRYHLEHINICDKKSLDNIFMKHRPDMVFHLAAESHVDRSIASPEVFVKTNILGTFNMLESSRLYLLNESKKRQKGFRFLHISTDEVYGDLQSDLGLFKEDTAYNPSSPYSSTKASADHLVRAWHRTYGLPIIITNCSNNFGPYQFPEKLIPLVILNAIQHESLPVYGEGKQIRDWLFVEDHVKALYLVINKGNIGESYNIGARNEKSNIEIVHTICDILDDLVPIQSSHLQSYKELICFVEDRPGHDFRYAIDPSKVNEIGWSPKESFQTGVMKTVLWYLNNESWCKNIQDRGYSQNKRKEL